MLRVSPLIGPGGGREVHRLLLNQFSSPAGVRSPLLQHWRRGPRWPSKMAPSPAAANSQPRRQNRTTFASSEKRRRKIKISMGSHTERTYVISEILPDIDLTSTAQSTLAGRLRRDENNGTPRIGRNRL